MSDKKEIEAINIPVDEHVGLKLKIKRSALGITQHELGDMVGVTFQQIQKYERGANRIGAGRLYEFAKILNVPINYFYDGFNEKNSKNYVYNNEPECDKLIISDREIITLVKYFSRIKNKKIRNSITNMIKTLTD